MTNETIQTLTLADAADVSSIIADARERAAFPIGPTWTREQVESECATGLGWTLKTDTSQIQAFIIARDVGAAFEISFLATASNAQRYGRMEKLIRDLTLRLPAGKAIWLEVHEANKTARRLYEKCGFREVGRRPKYYSDGGTAVLYNYR